MTKVVYLAESFGSYHDPGIPISRIMHYSGHNIGNFAFWNGARKLFDADMTCIPFGATEKHLPRDIDFFVIPAANFLNTTSDLGWLANLIVKIDRPCVVVGLGAQSEKEDQIPVLKEGTIRFLQEAARRTPFLAVRGPFTEKVCAHYGVTNVKVLGCPSIFTNGDRTMAERIAAAWDQEVDKIAVHAASIKSHVMAAERYLFGLLRTVPGSAFVLQRPVELMKLVRGLELAEAEQAYVERVRQFLAPDLSMQKFMQVLRQTGMIPYSVDSWIFTLQSHSHSLGTRIHGAILSLSSYLPTICITHDTRTRELCSVLQVPSIRSNQVTSASSVREIFASIRMDAAVFEDNRSTLASGYKALMNEIGIGPSRYLTEKF
ncbi:polysaccharide pyruvyl transferase [Siccirubricoccus deserti]|uniref:Polysaccharide pyruvyl transferase family protein n=1 Tax=Siccirubricoccus deserti TaxID=2013562 RepID=A0A9X0R167_9PROT|nr:polysaccharide pyruvyl transferase family protein [Siccirubricoccus deserti]MBC4016563.1 polysaccharide pyruvyl transferase family protein [Siccirubricoccus deserti]GGC50078.1 polysaccharide pyruvyl transferase [Siccirubricoccus deserti]